MQHFHAKLLCQKPILRHIEWGVQNGSITKNGVLPVTIIFWKICFILRTPLYRVDLMYQPPKCPYLQFRKR